MKASKDKAVRRKRRHLRVSADMFGTKERPRLVVYRSLNYTYATLWSDETGKVLVSAHDMKAKKGSRLERAKTVGQELGEKAKKAGIEACIFDRNGYKYHGRVKALAEGAREAGLKF